MSIWADIHSRSVGDSIRKEEQVKKEKNINIWEEITSWTDGSKDISWRDGSYEDIESWINTKYKL